MFHELLIILFISVLIVSLLRKLHLPPILGYLLTGVLVSPNWLAFVQTRSDLAHISEFGVVFLLFMIGLELSTPKLVSMRRTLVTLGGGQVALTSAIVIFIACFAAQTSLAGAIAIAGALALSSTAVVTKQLIEQSELQGRYGQLVLSILLFQDLAAVPFLIIIPSMAEGVGLGTQLFTVLPKGILVVSSMVIAGRFVLRPLFHLVAQAKSSELFMLTALLVVLSSAWLTEAAGLEKELGAFLAGVMLAETEYAHQIESDIQPFRDVLLGLFFVTVGVRLDPYLVMNHLGTLILFVCALVLIKTAVVYLLARYGAGHDNNTAFRSGLALAQGGEFGFAILSLDSTASVLPQDSVNIVTAGILLSIAIAPILIRKSEIWAKKLFKNGQGKALADALSLVDTRERKGHVIVCGYGRVGQSLALFLEQEDIPFVGIELDPDRLEEAANAGEPVFYGDATKEETILAAGLLQAKLVIITFDDPHRAKRMIQKIRYRHPSIPILVRTKDDRYLTALQQSGATEIIPETLEASLMMASHMLLLLGHAPSKVRQKIAEIKSYRYQMMRAYYSGKDEQESMEVALQSFAHAVVITAESFSRGKTISEIKEHSFPVRIRSFTRRGIRSFHEPRPDVVFEEGDIVIIEGTRADIYLAEERLIQG